MTEKAGKPYSKNNENPGDVEYMNLKPLTLEPLKRMTREVFGICSETRDV